jgi:hypothetical protein
MLDFMHMKMWRFAKERGRTKPALQDFIDACARHGQIEFNQTSPGRILLHLKGVDSPTICFEVRGNELITTSVTVPHSTCAGRDELMRGMDERP